MSFTCECKKVCKSLRGLTQHKMTCDGTVLDVRYRCESCGKICKSARGLSLHLLSCGKDAKTHTCEQCGKICKSERGLTSHRKSCDGTVKKRKKVPVKAPTEKELTCDVCNKVFKSRGGLSNHKNRTCNFERVTPNKDIYEAIAEEDEPLENGASNSETEKDD